MQVESYEAERLQHINKKLAAIHRDIDYNDG